MSDRERITVLGAGVIGLTSALVLAEAGYSVGIVARDLPEDSSSQGFASPWAGANWHSFVTAEDERQVRWETLTFKKIWSLIPRGLAMRLDAFDYVTEPHPPFWFKDLVPDYRELEPSEFPTPEVKGGVAYTTWSVNSPEYIKWLATRLRTLGVSITRGTVASIEEPFLNPLGGEKPATIVINATGLGARSLIGVEDDDVLPIRGQVIAVWAPHFKKTKVLIGDLSVPPTYIIPRPNGEVILGGTFELNEWRLSPDLETTKGILKRCCELDPSLSFDGSGPESLPIVKVNVGLRPARKGGARLEKETITVPFQRQAYKPLGSNVTSDLKPRQVDVIHAYGIGPAGFQASWGMADDVLNLVKESIEKRASNKN